MQEARRRIELILDPPSAEIGATYQGKVVNVTKFGAFVNILPGRDGLVHISKLGQGRRVERVEDVLNLGDDIAVRVDDIDQQGKVSLSPVGADGETAGGDAPPPARERAPRGDSGGGRSREPGDRAPRAAAPAADAPAASGAETVSFEAAWESEAASEFGDLGPAPAGGGTPREGFGGARRSDERGGDGPRRNPRRGGGGGRR